MTATAEQPLASSLLFCSQRKTEEGVARPVGQDSIASTQRSPTNPDRQAEMEVRWLWPGSTGLEAQQGALLCFCSARGHLKRPLSSQDVQLCLQPSGVALTFLAASSTHHQNSKGTETKSGGRRRRIISQGISTENDLGSFGFKSLLALRKADSRPLLLRDTQDRQNLFL